MGFIFQMWLSSILTYVSNLMPCSEMMKTKLAIYCISATFIHDEWTFLHLITVLKLPTLIDYTLFTKNKWMWTVILSLGIISTLINTLILILICINTGVLHFSHFIIICAPCNFNWLFHLILSKHWPLFTADMSNASMKFHKIQNVSFIDTFDESQVLS